MYLSDLGEKRLIAEILAPILDSPAAHVATGIGDDAAVLRIPPGTSLVVTIDKTPERLVAQSLGLIGYRELGHFLVAANASDLAAMGADPLAMVVSLGLPGDFLIEDLQALAEGIKEAAHDERLPIVGGDTKGASAVGVVACALGTVPGRALTRDGVRVGDVICVTGRPGRFGAALAWALMSDAQMPSLGAATQSRLLEAFGWPRARVAAGRALLATGAITACQDVSDGLGQTALELSIASSVGIDLDRGQLREAADDSVEEVASALRLPEWRVLLGPGSDFELVCSVAPHDLRLVEEAMRQTGTPFSVIGSVRQGSGLRLIDGDQVQMIDAPGFAHLSGDSDEQAMRQLYGGSDEP